MFYCCGMGDGGWGIGGGLEEGREETLLRKHASAKGELTRLRGSRAPRIYRDREKDTRKSKRPSESERERERETECRTLTKS
jgi:hypothetical protein